MYHILFEDNHLLIINKRPGELSQGDKTGDKSVLDNYKDYLKEKYNKKGNVFLGLVHRIDRPVSGALILAKTSKALTRLTVMLKERAIKKIYLAIVSGVPPEKGKLVHWLEKDKLNNQVKIYLKAGRGKEARLSYELLAVEDNNSLVKVNLETGRPHQIRAQFSRIGHPIIGDIKYGWKGNNTSGEIALHSYNLDFVHPVKKERIKIKAETNVNMYFNKYNFNGVY